MSFRDARRLFPPPYRRPSPVAVLVRWRVEVLTIGCLTAALYLVGGLVVACGVAVVAAVAAASRPVRRRLIGAGWSVLIPHRVRSGLLQAGVTDRTGRLPWIVGARTHDGRVYVRLWLRAGVTVADVRSAVSVLRSACGAAHVNVTHPVGRHDRAMIIVCRPRWGLPVH